MSPRRLIPAIGFGGLAIGLVCACLPWSVAAPEIASFVGRELARTYGVPIEDLIGSTGTEDPRVSLRPVRRDGMVMVPLSRRPGGIQAYKMIISRDRPPPVDELRVHEGFDWLYVLSGRLRLLLGERDLVLAEGEAAEFDTRVPHWFGSADGVPVEVLSLFGTQGERAHLRARTRPES